MASDPRSSSNVSPWLRVGVAGGVVALHVAVIAALVAASPQATGQGEPQVVQIRFVEEPAGGAPAVEAESPAEETPEAPAEPMPPEPSEPPVTEELQPEPLPEAEPDPQPQPQPQPELEPLPEPEPEPLPEPEPKPLPKPEPKPEPKPKPKPEPKPKPKPKGQPKPEPTLRSDVRARAAEPSAPPAAASTPATGAPDRPSGGEPVSGVPSDEPRLIQTVDYLNGPPRASYPQASRRLGEEGRVIVRVLIDTSGRVEQATVRKSSGHARLDDAAVSAAQRARFRPYMENGVPRRALADIPFDFKLR